jgi:two-component system, NtrC family, sensor histidine kinase HydH
MWTKVGVLLMLVAAVLAVLLAPVVMLERDRAVLSKDFAAARTQELDDALAEISRELETIADHLRLALELTAGADTAADRPRELRALVSTESAYRSLELLDGEAELLAQVQGVSGWTPSDALRVELDAAYAAALAQAGKVYASRPVPEVGAVLRGFALASADRALVAMLVVDTELIFSELRALSANPGVRLVLLGGHGVPGAGISPQLREAIATLDARRHEVPEFARLIDLMRQHQSGVVRLPAAEARLLALGDEEVVATFRPIFLPHAHHWSAALLASMAGVIKRERGLVHRMIGVLAVSLTVLFAIGVAVVLNVRRTARLRERLRRADEIAHLHEKADKVLDTIPTGVIVLGDNGRVSAVNAALRRRLGAVAEADHLSEVMILAEPSALEQIAALIESAKQSNAPRSWFGEVMCLFGEPGSYNLHAVPLEPRFADARVLLVIEDLSMIGSLERQLLRSEKLATVGVLAAGIAHELGTPLGIARGRAEYALGRLAAGDPQADGYRVIIEQVDQVARTIRRLLDFSRATPPGPVGAIDVAAVVRGVVDLVRLEADRRGVAIALALAEPLPRAVANAEELEQVLVNLIMNACDACERSGTISVSVDRCPTVGDALRIVVADDGHGIADEHRQRIFDPFFTTKKRGLGTGLGMTIVAQIVRNHGGTVDVASAPGRGTQVTVVWPAALTAPRGLWGEQEQGAVIS